MPIYKNNSLVNKIFDPRPRMFLGNDDNLSRNSLDAYKSFSNEYKPPENVESNVILITDPIIS